MSAAVYLYRLAHWLHDRHIPVVPVIFSYLLRFIFSCWLPHTVRCGSGLVLGYGGLGVVVHGDTVLGDNVHIDQHVTIGGNATEFGVPVIGSDVYIGAGAAILGPIRLGDNCVVGANAVVLRDVPAGSVVVGAPAHIVRSGIVLKDFLHHMKISSS